MPYFPYYHRHLLICVEMALNYAEEVLIGGSSKLPRELYESHKKEFDDVFEKYKEITNSFKEENGISGRLPQLSMHYWDPSDYTHSLDLPE